MFGRKKIKKLEERVRRLENRLMSICNDHSFDYFGSYSPALGGPEHTWVKCMKCGFEKRVKLMDLHCLKVKQRTIELDRLIEE